MSSWYMGAVIAFIPNFQKGIAASEKIIELLTRQPLIRDCSNGSELPLNPEDIQYCNVKFAYKNRPNVKVLNGLNLEINQGKTIALVGSSGCGKSTMVQLLQRFYDPDVGNIKLGDMDIRDGCLVSLRANFGVVSQEPVLFNRSIEDNIAYGDNNRVINKQEVIQAAKQANIHTFIASLPMGYDTRIGEKGTQLSGGQKQRIAIARALVRNPRVLLLDEATSALDSESEKIVQEALTKAKKHRTCITIAHRLITIQDADVICVLNKGRIEEMGSHSELLKKRGLYYKLQTL